MHFMIQSYFWIYIFYVNVTAKISDFEKKQALRRV